MSIETLSIQERLYPDSTCFGCGRANPSGLHLRSYVTEDGVTATFHPGAEHSNGMNTLNGGIIATLLDCHSGAAVFYASAEEAGRLTDLWVTTGLELRYRLPTAMDLPVTLHARIVDTDETSMQVKATLSSGGKVKVQAESRWARVRMS